MDAAARHPDSVSAAALWASGRPAHGPPHGGRAPSVSPREEPCAPLDGIALSPLQLHAQSPLRPTLADCEAPPSLAGLRSDRHCEPSSTWPETLSEMVSAVRHQPVRSHALADCQQARCSVVDRCHELHAWRHAVPPCRSSDLLTTTRSWLYVPVLLNACGLLQPGAAQRWESHTHIGGAWSSIATTLRSAPRLPLVDLLQSCAVIERGCVPGTQDVVHSELSSLLRQTGNSGSASLSEVVAAVLEPEHYIPARAQELLLQCYGGIDVVNKLNAVVGAVARIDLCEPPAQSRRVRPRFSQDAGSLRVVGPAASSLQPPAAGQVELPVSTGVRPCFASDPEGEVMWCTQHLLNLQPQCVLAAWRSLPCYSQYITDSTLDDVLSDVLLALDDMSVARISLESACGMAPRLGTVAPLPIAVAWTFAAVTSAKPECFLMDLTYTLLANVLHPDLAIVPFHADPSIRIKPRYWSTPTGGTTAGKSPTFNLITKLFIDATADLGAAWPFAHFPPPTSTLMDRMVCSTR